MSEEQKNSKTTDLPDEKLTEECTSHAALPDETIDIINDALQDDEHDIVDKHISELSPADIGDLMEKLSDDKRKKIIEEHRDELDAEDYAEIDEDVRKKILESMPATEVAEIIDELDSDDALDVTLNLEDDFRRDIIRHLPAKTRNALEEGYAFPEDSAGRLMQREFIAIPEFWTVGQTIDFLRGSADELPENFSDIFIVTPTYHVVGEIPLHRFIISCRDAKLKDLSLESVHPIPAEMDQEEAAHIFRRENINSAPIVDEHNRLIGVITIDDIVDVIDEEAEEDILKLGGLEQSDIYSAVWKTSVLRFKWLFVNLLTAILASSVISLFDATISELVALAVLMPIVASMGGNAGTQALTIAIRAIATKELSSTNALRIIGKETMVGTINGSAFAIIAGIVAGLWFSNPILDLAKTIVRTKTGVIAALMVHKDQADAMICGTVGRYAKHLRDVTNILDIEENLMGTSAISALSLPRGTFFIADTYVRPDPTAEELVETTLLAAEEVRRFGITPKVALVSHSDFGSSKHPSAVKMRKAYELLRKQAPDLEVDGEMHADCALSEEIRNIVNPNSTLKGVANLLVMPNLDAANIAFNMLKVLGDGIAIGPMLMGTKKTAHILTPSCTTRGIVNMAAVASVGAQEKKA